MSGVWVGGLPDSSHYQYLLRHTLRHFTCTHTSIYTMYVPNTLCTYSAHTLHTHVYWYLLHTHTPHVLLQLIEWFEEYAEEFFQTHTEIGESLDVAETLMAELKQFENSTQVSHYSFLIS